jgi:hypothetical protein
MKTQPRTERTHQRHGDSYSDVGRDEDLIGTSSSHVPPADRRPEEPSEDSSYRPDRLEDEL